MKVKCSRCGYEWERHGKNLRFTCPNCGKTLLLDKDTTVPES
jgi:hypothetical protein